MQGNFSPLRSFIKIRTNQAIAIKYFWEHAQFGWGTQKYMVNRSAGFRGYRALIVTMTKKATGMMADPKERSVLEAFLVKKYGSDLVPSEATLGFPGDLAVGDLESWELAFERLSTLYGKEVGISRRSGKDLQKYRPHEGLLREPLTFSKVGTAQFKCGSCEASPELILQIQEFPREHLYRVESNGTTILEFDDWPTNWSRKSGEKQPVVRKNSVRR